MYSSDQDDIASDVGRVYTNEIGESDEDDNDSGEGEREHDTRHTNDNDDEEEGVDDVDNDDDDDGLLRYLFDRDSLQQHAFAILVALVATAMSYFHLLGNDTSTTTSTSTISSFFSNRQDVTPIPSAGAKMGKRLIPLKPTKVHHHHAYQRTRDIFACPIGLISPSDSHASRIQRSLALSSGAATDPDAADSMDPNLQLFQFNFPKQYTNILNDYYVADSIMDDDYNHSLQSHNDMTDNLHFQCLIDATIDHQHRSTIPINAIAYIHPTDMDNYYRNNPEEMDQERPKTNTLSVQNILRETQGHALPPKHERVSLTYTGFTAKFINLSTKPMLLFWDGKNKPKLRSRIEPFESFSTVTFPGNSFFVSPIYDKDHAMERWVMVVDEAVVAYDAISNDDGALARLTPEERKLYEMQKLNLDYGREYMAVAKKNWLSVFPRPRTMHFMYDAAYFGQKYVVRSDQSHFDKDALSSSSLSSSYSKDVWKMLDYADYDRMVNDGKEGKLRLNLPQYRNKGPVELTLKVISVAPRVFEIEHFLSDAEVDHLMEMATRYNTTKSTHSASTTNGSGSSNNNNNNNNKDANQTKKHKKKPNDSRTNAWIRREMSPVVDAIYHRTADVLNIDESLLRHRNEHEHTELNTHHSIAEAMHITQFVTGQGYVPRSDSKPSSIRNRYQPNRFATIFFFLNDVAHGDGDADDDGGSGDTVFPLAVNDAKHDGIRVVPKKGNAVILYNMLPDGNVDDLSHHASTALEGGEKWMGTLYVWDPIID